MVKQAKQKLKTIKDPQDYPISKSKTLLVNLNAYIRMLKKIFPTMTSKEFIKNVHRFIDKIKRKLKFTDQNKLVEARQKIKICKKCDNWSGSKSIIQCNLCEDYYHETCLKKCPSADERDIWCCETCDKETKRKKNDKNEYLKNHNKADQCEKCDRGRNQYEAFINCMKCNCKYHKSCYGKPNAVCYSCHQEVEKAVKQKLKQQNLLKFNFEINGSSKKKTSKSPAKYEHGEDFKIFGKQESKNYGQRIREEPKKYNSDDQATQSTMNPYPNFKKAFPQMTEEEIEKYKNQALYAITAKGMNYTNDLVYSKELLNNRNFEQSLDFGLMNMNKLEEQIYEKYRKQPFGPYKFVYKEGMGYDVVADKDLPESMLVCEYLGDVVTYRQVISKNYSEQHNDSLFELSVGSNADQTLYIRPSNHTNMGRFINGVNNKTGTHKINVASVRMLYRGRPGVFLYTTRKISKGQSLAYDYNAGGLDGYYTEEFV